MSMGFYTGFANEEIFDALYNLCDPGENGENIRHWHSSSTGQDTTVLSENDEYINISCLIKKKNKKAVDSPTNLCGISGAKEWDRLIKGFPSLH